MIKFRVGAVIGHHADSRSNRGPDQLQTPCRKIYWQHESCMSEKLNKETLTSSPFEISPGQYPYPTGLLNYCFEIVIEEETVASTMYFPFNIHILSPLALLSSFALSKAAAPAPALVEKVNISQIIPALQGWPFAIGLVRHCVYIRALFYDSSHNPSYTPVYSANLSIYTRTNPFIPYTAYQNYVARSMMMWLQTRSASSTGSPSWMTKAEAFCTQHRDARVM